MDFKMIGKISLSRDDWKTMYVAVLNKGIPADEAYKALRFTRYMIEGLDD